MVRDKYLIVGNARIGAFDWNLALTSFLNAGASYASAVAQANAQQQAYAAQQQAIQNQMYPGNPNMAPDGSVNMFSNLFSSSNMPYVLIGGALLAILILKKR